MHLAEASVKKKRKSIPQSAVVRMHNTSMDSTDLYNQYLAYYRCSVRTKKWTSRILSILWYRTVGITMRIIIKPRFWRNTCPLENLKYEENISGILRKRKASVYFKFRWRRIFKKRRKVVTRSIKEARLGNVGHLPNYMDEKIVRNVVYLNPES